MTRIRRLPPEIANRIAAGEVVERPASVAKELLENALDAGARHIELTVDGGGIERIRVADDGGGIAADEVVLAFERHATNKIRDAADLETIRTLGFRGEALASIAAVSHVEITTAAEGAASGTCVRLEGGRVVSVERAARARGTTIEVGRLFYNAPARRKFMKTPATESRFVARLAGHVALGDFARTRGERQILIVNGRAVSDASLSHAVLSGIGGAMPSGRFPIFAIALSIDPARIDVNVHPTKREIRFADRDRVYGAIRESVARAASSVSFDAAARVFDLGRRASSATPAPAAPIRFGLPDDVAPATGLGKAKPRPAADPALRFAPAATEAPSETAVEDADASPAPARLRLLGEAWGAYLLVEDRDRILVIDQHAAHERVLYDEIRAKSRTSGATPAQGLLVPLPIDLGPGQDAPEACELLQSLGFDAREGGPSTVFVEAIPGSLTRWGGGDFLREFFSSPQSARASAEALHDAIAKSYSCKMAVKFGQRLHPEEIRHLLESLSRTDVPRVCPHGRPIFLEIARSTVDAKFERT